MEWRAAVRYEAFDEAGRPYLRAAQLTIRSVKPRFYSYGLGAWDRLHTGRTGL